MTGEEAQQGAFALPALLQSVVNMALRGATLASKFLFIVYLAKVLPPEEVGVYGLFTATVSYALYLLGVDFYSYAQRELFSLPRSEWGGVLRNQLLFYLVVYAVLFPPLLLLFPAGVLPWRLAGWFFLLLTCEHLSQELYRLLVVCGRVTLGNLSLFFRGGAWVFVVALLFSAGPGLERLTLVWAGWTAGVAASIAIGGWGIRDLAGNLGGSWSADWGWMRRGMKVGLHFLVGTLALRGLFTFDRYLLDLYAGKSAVGVYSFFLNLANALTAFADAGVVARLYPRIVTAYRSGQRELYRRLLTRLLVNLTILNAAFAAAVFVAIGPVLEYIGKGAYLAESATLWILVLATSLYCLGLVPHYALYARGQDRAIVASSVLALLVFLAAAFILTPAGGVRGMAAALVIGVAGLGACKALCALRAEKVGDS